MQISLFSFLLSTVLLKYISKQFFKGLGIGKVDKKVSIIAFPAIYLLKEHKIAFL